MQGLQEVERMRALLRRVGVRRCTDAEGAPEPTQCGSGVAAACGCGKRPPCLFTITELAETAGRRDLGALPRGGRGRQARLITAALGLNATIPAKGMLGRPHGTKNWPVVGFRLGGEVEGAHADFDLKSALDRLCNGEVSWGYGDGERQQLGADVARADPRYEGQVEHDAHAWECYLGYHDVYYDSDESGPQVNLTNVKVIEDAGKDESEAPPERLRTNQPFVPYHRPADEAELTAASQRQWSQRRAIFDTMPDGMPAVEQVWRVSLALHSSAAEVDALNTWNAYREGTVASMLSELADEVGPEVLGDQLASGILSRAARGARSVGLADAQTSSALIPMMMRVAKRVGVAGVEEALRALVAPAAPTVGDAASPSTATPNAPAVPAAHAETASSSTAAPAAPGSNGWMCPACNTKYSNSDDVCTSYARGQQCNSTRAMGIPVGEKRTRTATQRLDVHNGAGQTYESGSGGAPPPGPRSGVAGGGVQGNTATARGKGRAAAATPALLPPAVLAPLPEDAPLASVAARDAKETALAEIGKLLVGDVADVKKTVTELCDSVIYGLLVRERTGDEPHSANNHMLFLGNPGTGKTTVAKIVARLLKGLGVVATEKVLVCDNARTALVDGHVGCTAGKAAKVLTKAVGGVLFLDEAYTLVPGTGGHDYSQEAIDVLLAKSEEHRYDTVIILAGYSDKMDQLLKCNPGLASRFPTRVAFNDYLPPELMKIAEQMAVDRGMRLEDDALRLLRDHIERVAPLQGNARDVRNLMEKVEKKRAARVVGMDGKLPDDQLKTATAADIEGAVADIQKG